MPAVPLFPPQASTLAGEVDTLYFFLVAVTVFFSLLIAAGVVFFAIAYRRRSERERPEEIHGSLALELVWTVIPLLLTVVMFAWGAQVFFHMNRPPDDAMNVAVVGKRWMWKLQHPTGQREINELHIPVGRPVKLTITSEDTIHSFFVPAFRLKKDAVPGRYNYAWFEATKTGTYHLFCAEYCGTEHSTMIGRVVVMEPDEYQTWLAGGPPPESPVKLGERLFVELNCVTCHRIDALGRGPLLHGIFGKPVRLASGETVIADAAYLRESILNPAAKVAAGYQPVMPTYQGQVSEESLLALIAYIQSLPAPVGAPVPVAAAAPAPSIRREP
ncbi:MAG TPA: cytochrome c oxidase subunit II [Vicinamibacteria bacterium]|nr:cytochrome c oxidase subunit II [Vicinamibacteria bacterium]